MADFPKNHPLGDLEALIGQHSHAGPGPAAITIYIRPLPVCAQLFASKGNESKLASKLKLKSTPGLATDTKSFTALPLSPGQWMLMGKAKSPDFAREMAKKTKGLGYISQQADSRICLRVSGPMARQLMARGCRLDLHASNTGAGFCAQTNMAQIGVIIHQLDDHPTYDLYLYSGFARSFFHWLSHTAEQFGYEVTI